MKKLLSKKKATSKPDVDEILPEYDFTRASPNLSFAVDGVCDR